MKAPHFILTLIQFAAITVLNSGCVTTGSSGKNPLSIRPFISDGCTCFPDGTFADKTKWRQCCVVHDKAYWLGGTRAERRKADEVFERCVYEESGNVGLAKTAYNGVRIFGSPVNPAGYRWGFGWPYGRTYKALTVDERDQAKSRLRE